ncbi:MAG: type II toxin-antitoxin system mRNA interferase toxin, RelE/StbE family [Paraburkholderia sp.]|uniref:type II toxin-antitoxin system YafQ family toxin n=1 Tax=Paraburkholderia sp. TaxID=1926495 RepID=UPI00040F1269
MRTPVYSNQFHRDVKRAQKSRKDMEKLKALITLLLAGGPLPAHYRDHPLKGEWASFRDAHLEPDWLLLYKIDGNVLRLERTGTHADLFDE